MNVRSDDTSRQVIDIAVGILIGVRGYSRREAFDAWDGVVGSRARESLSASA